eukprot:CAMPEP_0170525772 /NCGR_PEP_ID=MMETSP0209-20121228/11217_1 /TAXON_ID=665100 ORGANISM="Litonotus pictus, Strain P1" /NCGR_SAMPLE_ID=MMETSP0209 /ASSEMBLY_ACC=CAM_ASM_000301 /LENGTH=81 /DNA_ID=CAMNT_0010815207 /DNA_START=479 /DNA_END=724 /DNA_ORIENTATION=+
MASSVWTVALSLVLKTALGKEPAILRLVFVPVKKGSLVKTALNRFVLMIAVVMGSVLMESVSVILVSKERIALKDPVWLTV